MIIGALQHRDRSYDVWLAGGPMDGAAHVLHPLVRLGDWLAQVANTGCLFLNALAEYPDSGAIAAVVRDHKSRLARQFALRLDRVAPGRDTADLAETLFLLHEGMTQAARLQGRDRAYGAAMRAARAALKAADIP